MGEILIPRRTKVEKGYELLADITVDSSITAVDIEGLNIGKDDELLLVSDINRTVSSLTYLMFVNGNTTQTNYYVQELYANGGSVVAGRVNQPHLTSSEVNQKTALVTRIKLANSGYLVWQSDSQMSYSSAANKLDILYVTSTFSIASITSLTIFSTQPNGIGIGSRFQLYKIGGA